MIEWEARTRWGALIVEAFVLCAAAHRTRKPVLAVTAALVWGASLVFFLSQPAVPSSALLSSAGVVLAALIDGSRVARAGAGDAGGKQGCDGARRQ